MITVESIYKRLIKGLKGALRLNAKRWILILSSMFVAFGVRLAPKLIVVGCVLPMIPYPKRRATCNGCRKEGNMLDFDLLCF